MTTTLLNRKPVHPSITEQQISDLVEKFYARIAEDARLAPIFLSRNGGDWSDHFATMKRFWSSVLLRSGAYSGNPVSKHNAIEELRTSDFIRWLALFRETTSEMFSVEAVPLVNEIAKRIARSLWMSKLGSIHESPPF